MKKEVIFLHYDWLAWIDWTHLMEMLFVPICILVASLTIGIMLNKLINRRIENHLNIDEDSWFYIFINALRGVPVSLCLVVGLYWIVNTNTINIIEPLTRLFSYILFTTVTSTFAINGSLSPAMAAWIPNILYTFIAIYLYRKAPR